MDNTTIDTISFGKRLKRARENMNLTQAKLAEKVDISVNFLGDIERGLKLPSVTNLITMSNILKTSIDVLFFESLNNTISEPETTYYTDNQIAVILKSAKNIADALNK